MLSNEDLKNMAITVIEDASDPVSTSADAPASVNGPVINGDGVTVVLGDNPGGIRQTFRRR
ncbi:hypothetical protein ACIQKE_36375 [Streptomyces griseoviridis]